MKTTRSFKQKGTQLELECGHVIEWPRPTTARGKVWCPTCEAYIQIRAAVRRGD